jgi:nitrogenase subunit NifH
MKGERRYYDRQVAVSSVSVEVYELGEIASGGVAEPVREALHRSLGLLATSVSMLIYAAVFLAPWAGLLAGAWWLGARLVRRAS